MILSALHYAAGKHQAQRRKGAGAAPYINHPIEVATLLATIGKVQNPELLAAALLHDVLEDTNATPAEIARLFGKRVLSLVQEVTDDKRLPDDARRQRQIEHAPHLSRAAQQIKLADKISNLNGIINDPPVKWRRERQLQYLDWSAKVIAGISGCNPALERMFAQRIKLARKRAGARCR
jgi:guanosine-3',5'-bis(diphosphate) 3'-pyrophosphohydrolase